MDLKEELLNSIKGLKQQSKIALASQGDNKKIGETKLKKATHSPLRYLSVTDEYKVVS